VAAPRGFYLRLAFYPAALAFAVFLLTARDGDACAASGVRFTAQR
jgi:hypothetical protein